MAEMPVPVSTTTVPSALPEPMARLNIPGRDFLRGAVNMPVVRQVTLIVALAGAVALGLFAALWMQDEDLRPVASVTTPEEAGQLTQLLDAARIPYQLDHRSGSLLVPVERFYEARMQIAGIVDAQQDQIGYELLDQEQGFGVSQFMEDARHRRSVEGELARSVVTIDGVQHARVLLAMPKSTTFLRDRRKPSASVTVTLRPGKSLSPEQVKGITNLVAAAVPELETASVAVVDQSGRLLSRQDEDPALEATERQLAFVSRIELGLQGKIEQILEQLVGPGAYTAQVTADVDFTREEQASEQYAPQQATVRSESNMSEERVGALPIAGIPGTLSNQPPPDPVSNMADNTAAGGETTPRTTRNESTRNYEVDRTVRYQQQSLGRLSRLAVSVVVDYHRETNAETGEMTATPWTDEEIKQLHATIASAVGVVEDRGDTLSVASSPFHRTELEVVEPPPFWTEVWFTDLLKQVLGGLVLLLVAVGLLRPLYRTLSRAGEMVHERQAMEIADINQAREQIAQHTAMGLPAPEPGQALATSSLARLDAVRGLVSDDPQRVAEVVKAWVANDE
ncbi:MAG: flagellar M-ring protein FliF [Pseudomonadales bacterium]|nr:flagellar M-ring protein FliF [Pseudomonadales bacterium]